METDYLEKMRLNFYFSNYRKVLEIWKTAYKGELKLSEELRAEYLVVIQRTIIKLFKNNENLFNENKEYFGSCENSLELYINYYSPLVSDVF